MKRSFQQKIFLFTCIIFLLCFTIASCDNKNSWIKENQISSTYLLTYGSKEQVSLLIGNEKIMVEQFNVFPNDTILRPHFRVPSILLTKSNVTLVTCENRQTKSDKGEIDILLGRKELSDEWDIHRIYKYNDTKGRAMNPILFEDSQTNRVYLFYCLLSDTTKYARDHKSSEVDFVYKSSDDEGKTWSQENSLKAYWDLSDYTAVIPSTSKGIRYNNEVFIIPTMVIKGNEWYSGLLINENGAWKFSKPTPMKGDNECTVYLDRGNVVLDCRTYENTRRRYYYDLKEDEWTQANQPILNNAVAVSAEIIFDNGVYYMSYPDSKRNQRDNISLWVSFDGIKWTMAYHMMEGYADYGYSGIAVNDYFLKTVYETPEGIFVQDVSNCRDIIRKVVKRD